MNRVLFIAYQIPPIGGPATQRHLRFLRRLREFGWMPVVLTVNPDYCEEYYPIDDSLFKWLPSEISIYRTISFNPMDKLLQVRARFKKHNSEDLKTQNQKDIPCESCGNNRRTFSFKDFVTECFRIPDRQIGWYPFAVAKGLQIIKKENIDIIYSSANPWTSHLIGLRLAKMSNLPWVADFRDPWTHNPYKEKRFAFIERLEERMEKKVVSAASFVIANTEPLRDHFIHVYPAVNKNKFIHISNGYLDDMYRGLSGKRNSNKLIISHVGTLYVHRSPLSLLRTVAELKKEKLVSKKNFLLQFIGKMSPDIERSFQSKLEIDDIVKTIPTVPHTKAIQYLMDSNVLLLIQPSTYLQIPGKLFEYVAVGRPILALTGKGATADLIEKEKLGIVVDPADKNSIKKALVDIINRHKSGKLFNLSSKTHYKFESRYLTQKLVSVFDACLASRQK